MKINWSTTRPCAIWIVLLLSMRACKKTNKYKNHKNQTKENETENPYWKPGELFFQKAEFLKYLGFVPSGSKVTCRYFAIKFQLKNKHGVMPSNAGQVLLAFTKANGINTDKFNTCRRVSCRDFVQRIRRS